ncbi:hypothetical protein [Inquilinus sp. OTU3971]|uniref:hypothetical protein n=1 Tax=Inquilinus sp. OTU3971 TaxID=3043855 RepID=UPI00313F0908
MTAFTDMIAQIADDTAKTYALDLSKQFDARAEYERAKNSDNDTIQAKLKSAAARLSSVSAAKVLIAANVSETFVNRAERNNARYNVYAIDKLSNIVDVLVNARTINAISNACIRSMITLEEAKIDFSHKLALASASDKITVDNAQARKRLTRHNVSASTASTQASSTMNALVTLHIVEEYTNDARETCYRFADSDVARSVRALYTAS